MRFTFHPNGWIWNEFHCYRHFIDRFKWHIHSVWTSHWTKIYRIEFVRMWKRAFSHVVQWQWKVSMHEHTFSFPSLASCRQHNNKFNCCQWNGQFPVSILIVIIDIIDILSWNSMNIFIHQTIFKAFDRQDKNSLKAYYLIE